MKNKSSEIFMQSQARSEMTMCVKISFEITTVENFYQQNIECESDLRGVGFHMHRQLAQSHPPKWL